jgi:hypothetical protein
MEKPRQNGRQEAMAEVVNGGANPQIGRQGTVRWRI